MALTSQPSKLLAKFLMACVREPGGVNQRLMVSGMTAHTPWGHDASTDRSPMERQVAACLRKEVLGKSEDQTFIPCSEETLDAVWEHT